MRSVAVDRQKAESSRLSQKVERENPFLVGSASVQIGIGDGTVVLMIF